VHNRILIIRPGALGDFILTLPVIAGLRELYPAARLEVMARGGAACLAAGLADKTGDLNACELSLPGRAPDYVASFDLVIAWSARSHSAYLPGGSAGQAIVVSAEPPAGVPASLFFFRSVPQLRRTAWKPSHIELTDEERAMADRLLAEKTIGGRRPLVAVHPGSGSRKKCWPAEHFARVVSALLQKGHGVVLLEGEADARAVENIREKLSPERVGVLRSLPPRTLAAVLSRCDRYLGNDSGVSHLAAAVGSHCTAIFGPTDPGVWGPTGSKVTILTADIDCRPCGKTNPDCRSMRCLTGLTPERVLRAVSR